MTCELIGKCEFFQTLSEELKAVKQGFILRYCMSKKDSERCARKLFRKTEGRRPPANMTPAGGFLETAS